MFQVFANATQRYMRMFQGCIFFQMHTNAPQQIFNYVSRTCLVYTGMLLLLLSSTRTKLWIFAGKFTSVERKLNLMLLRLHLFCHKERWSFYKASLYEIKLLLNDLISRLSVES